MSRRIAPRPEMQQRFASSYALDPEAHQPLLYTEATPPLPPKTQPTARQDVRSGDVDEWGFRLRAQPVRVPVPPMYVSEPESMEERARPPSGPDVAAPISMPEPSVVHRLFPTSALLQFPKIQFTRDNPRLGRLPSLRIQFLRESNQVVSSPVTDMFPDNDRRLSVSSGPSTLNRPFATMAVSPLVPLAPLSPVSISRVSPSARSDSVASVGQHLFARKASAEDGSDVMFSRASSQPDGLSPSNVLGQGNGSSASFASSARSDANSGMRVDTAWSPNVMASYSPWKGVVHGSWTEPSQLHVQARSPQLVESPAGQLRVMDAWRPMPTVSENTENAATISGLSLPRPLPEPPATTPPPPSPPSQLPANAPHLLPPPPLVR
ncbi:hypothetical protein BC628DRAFT_1368232 [Trametes gibbosa]|nr:hypothetical protein BC628DRAFT_1368232 [Trametes gibbosa]